jgi:DNA-binding winged helix-turn-helix (wHTH) protein/TolB-like protein
MTLPAFRAAGMSTRRAISFGPYRLEPDERALYRGGNLVPLPLKAVEVLLALVEGSGRILSREELFRRVWPDVVVEEGNLSRQVSMLRSALGGGPHSTQYIETVPKRGYRFVAPVLPAPEPAAAEEKGAPPAPEVGSGSATIASAAPGETLPSSTVAGTRPETPAARVPSSSRVRVRALVVVVVAALLVAGAVALVRRASEPRGRIMLVVLPVTNLTGDERQEVLSDGLTEELIGRIGGLDPAAMGVIARTSSMAYKGQRKTISTIGRELGVDFVLEGSLRWVDGRPRVAVQLVRVKDQTPVWAREYQQPLGELSTLPDAVALAVASATRLQLSAETQARLASRLRVQAEAYRAYLEGRSHLASRTREGLERALAFFEQAVALEPSYAPAHAGLADAHNLLQYYGYAHGAVGIIYAREAAQRALGLDEGLTAGHAALGYVNFMWLWEWPAAESEFRRDISLDPHYDPAHHRYALYLAAMGRPDEAQSGSSWPSDSIRSRGSWGGGGLRGLLRAGFPPCRGGVPPGARGRA